MPHLLITNSDVTRDRGRRSILERIKDTVALPDSLLLLRHIVSVRKEYSLNSRYVLLVTHRTVLILVFENRHVLIILS
jgi:hypothetical protein